MRFAFARHRETLFTDATMLEVLKRLKRGAFALCERVKIRREVRKAFAWDESMFMRNAGALHLDRKTAAEAAIVMAYHVLEKGLTMPHRRMGFGKGAVVHLINLVEDFEKRFGAATPQVAHAARVLKAYRELHAGWPEPMPRLDAFLAKRPSLAAAAQPHVKRDDFFAAKDAPFPAFAASRHVCRHFAGPVPKDALESALKIALTAPSACNRQHARVHVIEDARLRDGLFVLQGGTRGFGQDASAVLVVTADLSTARWAWERHDAYTNGGIFVLNLCYALHYCGIAHCILHWSVAPKADKAAHRLLGIPEREAIVQVLACGTPPEEFDIASSPRRSLEEVVTWHS